MKIGLKTYALIGALSLFMTNLYSQTQFFNGSWEELMKKAKKENKPIFVDLYFTGCLPCVKMDKEVFPVKEVSSHLNENFINYKVNVFKDDIGPQLNMKYGISGFPSFLFLSPDGYVIDLNSGYLSADMLLDISQEVLANHQKSNYKDFDPALDMDYPEFYKNLYLKGKPKATPAEIETYFETQTSLSDEIPFVILSRLGAPGHADFYIENSSNLAVKYSRKMVAVALKKPVSEKIKVFAETNDLGGFNAMMSKIKPVYNSEEWKLFSKNIYYPSFYEASKNADWFISIIQESDTYDWQDKSNAMASIIADHNHDESVLRTVLNLFVQHRDQWHSSGDYYKAALTAYYLKDYEYAQKWIIALKNAPMRTVNLPIENLESLEKAIRSKNPGFIDNKPVIDPVMSLG